MIYSKKRSPPKQARLRAEHKICWHQKKQNIANGRWRAAAASAWSAPRPAASRSLAVATTALAVLALLFLGGEVLRGFSIAMLWGIVIGTYSSLFIAAPLLYYVQPNRRTIARTAETEEAGAERASR